MAITMLTPSLTQTTLMLTEDHLCTGITNNTVTNHSKENQQMPTEINNWQTASIMWKFVSRFLTWRQCKWIKSTGIYYYIFNATMKCQIQQNIFIFNKHAKNIYCYYHPLAIFYSHKVTTKSNL